jgi:hypothetical protein
LHSSIPYRSFFFCVRIHIPSSFTGFVRRRSTSLLSPPSEISALTCTSDVNLKVLVEECHIWFFAEFCSNSWSGVIPPNSGPIVLVPDDKWEDRAFGEMRIGRGNRSTRRKLIICNRMLQCSVRRKPVPVPLHPWQIPYDLTWDLTRAVAVGSRRLTAWAVSQPPM